MGLAERRATKQFEENRLPTLQQQINEAAGFDVKLDINWEQLAQDDYAHLYDEAWTKVYFRPLIDAIKAVAFDDMGKEALKAGLRKVWMGYAGNSYEPQFETGTLKLDFPPIANLDYENDRRDAIRKTLEKNL